MPLNKVVAVFEQYFESEFNDDDWAYPNIVVDEGQDLSDSILEHLSFLAELQDGCFYIFYDRNQYIMSRKTTGWIDKNAECRLVLYKNCRNTAEIATSIGKLMHMKDSYVNTIQGMTPKAVFYGNEKRTAETGRPLRQGHVPARRCPERHGHPHGPLRRP